MRFWLPADDAVAAEAVVLLSCHSLCCIQAGGSHDAETERLWTALRSRFWTQTHAHLARAAAQLGVPFHRQLFEDDEFLQLGQGSGLRLCHETLSDRTPLFARAAANKLTLHRLLQERGIPLPAQESVESLEQALAAAERIGWPVVLKPVSGGKGRGVWVGLSGPEQLSKVWREAGIQERQLVQPLLNGDDHRLLVMQGRLMAVAQRRPALLVSDGRRTLGEQIAALNRDPRRGVGYERLLNRLPVDQRLSLLLQEQGFSMQTRPPQGTTVRLSRTANISQGGSAVDCSERIHPDNRRLAEDLALLLGSDVLGLDMISSDIGVSWREGGTWLLEANLSAGLRPHLVADPGTDLCQRIVRQWIGDGPRAGRIPTALITGSIGKTTTSRLLAHILNSAGLRTGLVSSTGVHLGDQTLERRDLAGGAAALRLLQDRRVEALVAEMARGGLLSAGVGLQADVCAVLNVLDNHVGMQGLRSRQDLARVKALVPQATAGLLALNADDPLVLPMGDQRPADQLALISREQTPRWQHHRDSGAIAGSYREGPGGEICLWQGVEPVLRLAIEDLPASEAGAVRAIAPAAAFAAAMALGLQVPVATIRSALLGFGLDPAHSDGRFELVCDQPWQVVLCSADGAEAITSLSDYAVSKCQGSDRRRVLMCAAADSRPDDYIRRMGQAAWGFDLVIAAAQQKRKGREAQEVPALLAQGIRSIHPEAPEVLESGVEIQQGVSLLAEVLRPGDFCVVTSFETDAMRARLRQMLARRARPEG